MAQSLEPQDVRGSCCNEKSTRLVTYDCGPEGFETYLVCDTHFNTDEAWNRSAVKVVELRK